MMVGRGPGAGIGAALRSAVSGRSARQPTGYGAQRTFEYVAVAASGARHKGRMQAGSAAAVATALQEDGWLPITINESSRAGLNTDLTSMFGRTEKAIRLSAAESAEFFRQAAELLAAGVAMSFVLQALGQEATPKVRKICDGLGEALAAGVPLSDAMESFPDAFDKVTRAYISSGEASGTLPQTMSRLAVTMEKRNDLRLKVKGVTAYPKMVSGVISLIVFAIIKFMVPMYGKIYANFGSELPRATRSLVTISENLLPVKVKVVFPTPFFIDNNIEFGILGVLGRVLFIVGFVVLTESMRNRAGKDAKIVKTIIKWLFMSMVTLWGGNYQVVVPSMVIWGSLIGVYAGIRYFVNSAEGNPKTARLVDRVRFKLPLIGKMARMSATFQWATTMSGSLSAGVPLARALQLAGATAGSRWYASLAEPMQAAILGGRPLSETLGDYSDLFSPSVRAMVATGEVTGDLSTMFDNIARAAETEVDAQIAGLAAKVEVLLLVVMGVVVGGLLIALYLPIINLATAATNSGAGG